MMHKVLCFSLVAICEIIFTFDVCSTKILIDAPIAEGEFIDRLDIEEVEFSDKCRITDLPDYAFLGCTNLKKVKLPKGLKKIGFQTFSECSALEEINLPSSLEDIGSNAFAYCSSLQNLKFPARLKHIGHNAFSFCDSLTEVFLPDSLEEIESYAFSDCLSLEKVRLPANDNLLGELMMNCCPNLIEIIAPSPKAPKFDCESYVFDPDDKESYARCVLKVPDISKDSYNISKSWQMFNKIVTAD